MPSKKQKVAIGVGMFPKPGGDAAHEFEKIITAGPDSMRQFSKRILPAVYQTIRAEEIADIAHGWSFQYDFVRDLLAEGANERYGTAEEEVLGWHENLLKLRDLLIAIENGLEMSNLKRRVQVFQKLVELFWTVFLVPMLRAEGVSKAQSDRSRGRGEGGIREQRARRLHDNGYGRFDIVDLLVATFGITKRMANIDCDRAGIPKRSAVKKRK